MFCAECGADEMRRTDEAFTDTFRGEKMHIVGVPHWKCDTCGELEFESDDLKSLDRAVNDNIRAANGLLSPAEIKAIRKSHGLSQQQFENVLGVTSPTVSRWETGSVVQSKPLDILMRAFRDHECVSDDMIRRAEIRAMEPVTASVCTTLRQLIGEDARKEGIRYVRS